MAPKTLDSLDAENLKPLVLQLLARIDDLLAQNKTLLSRIAELEAKLGQPPKTPTNSSLPPSRGQKANVPAPSREKKGRKGRPGVARALCADPDATREVYADTTASSMSATAISASASQCARWRAAWSKRPAVGRSFDDQLRWPNAYFAAAGLSALHTA
jgi:transposase